MREAWTSFEKRPPYEVYKTIYLKDDAAHPQTADALNRVSADNWIKVLAALWRFEPQSSPYSCCRRIGSVDCTIGEVSEKVW